MGEPVSITNTVTVTKTNVTIEGKMGGSVGGFTTTDRTISPSSYGLSEFSKEAIAYRGSKEGQGLSITMRDENASAKAGAARLANVVSYGGTASGLAVTAAGSLSLLRASTPIGIGITALSTFLGASISRGLETLPKSNEPCNSCTKQYTRP
ncbi:hypothetical protein KLP40_17295 [Hymenobacter sp. NST-14]|uniref:hypothetical protein n=1 Tax=Hymenobacter piscis TaxID=2839984 RepID=UPI001C016756|nr:hypothetical protein [Hymenobacter piscis]MBT9394925.1 hypothetical protein [Hymenobacter piscis]